MGDTTGIQWTDATVNFWWGCTKVGPGCDHCYAETWDKRTGGAHWGPHAPRRWIKGATEALRRINRTAPAFREKHGRWPRVFLHSMSDIFDNAVPHEWQTEALCAIFLAYNVQAQIVTKRVGNVEAAWARVGAKWPQNAGLLITVCTQTEADRDIPRLLDIKARLGIPWVGLSVEPMLEAIDVTEWLHESDCPIQSEGVCICKDRPGLNEARLDWVICGGESGPHARPMHPDWARTLRDQCVAAGVPFFFKQWGEWAPALHDSEHGGYVLRQTEAVGPFDSWTAIAFDPDRLEGINWRKLGKKSAGRLLDGREWNQFPGDA